MGLGDIVMVPAVHAARERGVLVAEPMFDRLIERGVAWDESGRVVEADTVIWCTGFRPGLSHLAPLRLRNTGTVTSPPRAPRRSGSRAAPARYGDWTGPASATLIGVGRPARDMVTSVQSLLRR